MAEVPAETAVDAPPPGVDADGDDSKADLFTRAFLALCVVGFLSFASQFIIQPVLPLLIVDRGGDEALVGLVVAAFSLPSVVMRPWMGRLVDEWSTRGVLSAGVVTLAVSSAAYLIPGYIALFAVRIVHGAGWAAFNTGGHSLVGRLAPPARRGEASGIYNLMPGLAQLSMPAIGLALLAAFGFDAPFLVAAGLAAAALIAVPLVSGRKAARPLERTQPTSRSLLERGAVLPMVIEIMFTSVQSLFLIYPPLFVIDRGLPLEHLTFYYPAVGITLVVSRAVLARLSDRVGRGPVLVGGATVAILGLAVAALANDVLTLAIGGSLWGLAASVTSPTAMALAIDRAERGRMGAAMATYSLGFQLGLGGGAAVWGVVIAAVGFSQTFWIAIGTEVALIALLVFAWRSLGARAGGRMPTR
ncbi:MAG: MFS transporter [Chloroflexota bacterium]